MYEKEDVMEDLDGKTDHELLLLLISEFRHLRDGCENFVTKDEFRPVRTLVYGFFGLVCTSVIVTVLARAF